MNKAPDTLHNALNRLSFRYAVGLALAQFVAISDAAAILIPLSGRGPSGAQAFFTAKNVIAATVLVVLGAVAIAAGGVVNLASTLRWFAAGQAPNPQQRHVATKLVSRQSWILAATWVVCGAILVLLNLDGGVAVVVPILGGVLLGGGAAAAMGVLFTQHILRPIMVAAARDSEGGLLAPGVFVRLTFMWLTCSALPIGVIAALVIIRSNGWIIQRTVSLDVPVLGVSLAAALLGVPMMLLISRSISDPVAEVVDAMAEVEHGRLGAHVGAYERSQIGRLQRGFNRMVAGLAERERLRDLFGRYVGTDVARRAVQEGAVLSGDVVEAAVLFIDLVGSTRLAASRPPQEVAGVLNDFFQIVVDAVDQHGGLVNKFQGDAALAIFGAPLRTVDPASAPLATARTLGVQLRRLPMVDFGVGVSAGRVFAGNIGAENRCEYTVIGDAVNEAARLAEVAKTSDRRILCSAAAINRADSAEQKHWAECYSAVLRGRSEATQMSAPAG